MSIANVELAWQSYLETVNIVIMVYLHVPRSCAGRANEHFNNACRRARLGPFEREKMDETRVCLTKRVETDEIHKRYSSRDTQTDRQY